MAAVVARAWARYGELLVARPLPTKAVTSGAITLAGDVAAQVGEGLPTRETAFSY
jgi:hypothetical protein